MTRATKLITLSLVPALALLGFLAPSTAQEDSTRLQEAVRTLDRRITAALTPDQVNLFTAGEDPSNIELANGESLEEFIRRVQQETEAGLVYRPVAPCLLLDTRNAANRLEGNDRRAVIVRGPAHDYSSYGGASNGCGIPAFSGDVFKTNVAKALFLSIELFGANSNTGVKLWPANSATEPEVSLIRGSGSSSSQAVSTIVPLCDDESTNPCAAGDLYLASDGGSADVAITILGYFEIPPAALIDTGNEREARSDKTAQFPFWEQGAVAGKIHYSDGNVGIGTDNPNAPLHIVGPSADYPGNRALRIQTAGNSSSFRDHVTISGKQDSGYGLAFSGEGHHRGGMYARNVGGTSSMGEVTLWSRGGGNIRLHGKNVGIGNSLPEERLDIAVDTRFKNSYLKFFNSHASYPEGFHDSRFRQWGRLSLALRTEGNAFAIEKWNASDRLGIIAHFDRDTRRVGIGTSSPKTPFAILGNGGYHQVGITQKQVGGSATMELTTEDESGLPATRLLMRGKSNNADIEFYRGGRGSEKLSVLIGGDNGNLGIGAENPHSPLSIKKDGTGQQVGITQNQVGGGASMELTTQDETGKQATRLLFRGALNEADTEFYRGVRGSEELSLFIEGENGYVGIGTNAPKSHLDVAGDITLSGNIRSGGDICIGNCG